jgi:integrase
MSKFEDVLEVSKFEDVPIYEEGSVAQLIDRFIQEKMGLGLRPIGPSALCDLRVTQRSVLGSKLAASLTLADLMEFARLRITNQVPTNVRRKERQTALSPATVGKSLSTLGVVLQHAADEWDLKIDLELFRKAKRKMKKEHLIAKAKARTRRPTAEELARLMELARKQNGHGRTKIPMDVIIEFSYEAGRRISETCRIRRKDVNLEKQTYWVYDLKNSAGKGVHHEFILVGRALEIVKERLAKIPDAPDARLFPYLAKSCSARYTIAKKRLGIVDLRLHDNRRECFSRLAARNYTVTQVQHGWSGHMDDAKTLQAIYTQINPAELLAVVKQREGDKAAP